ncbi:hypothetical protein DVH05_002106 [Phytophthora capsici]|nr:hypothetical protein DVH05_002106 [Phytophthora capsici]
MLREVVGNDVPISKETIEWVTECAGELLQVIGREANTVAEGAAKKENYRISQEHVMVALQNLGMQAYSEEIKALQGSMELEAQKKKSKKTEVETVSRIRREYRIKQNTAV